MEPRDADQIVRMIEGHYQTDFGTDGRKLWAFELIDGSYDPELSVKAVAELVKTPLPANRARPHVSDFRAVYFKLAKDREMRDQAPELPSGLPPRKPAWVKRWERARAAGDTRPFPEQVPGYESLAMTGNSPAEVERNNIAYATPRTPHDNRADWVQPDEYLEV